MSLDREKEFKINWEKEFKQRDRVKIDTRQSLDNGKSQVSGKNLS